MLSLLDSIDPKELLAELAEHGALLLRGMEMNLTRFSELVETVTPRTAIDPARAFFAKNVQLVDSGTAAIGLHCENGTTPLVPEIVWFYCERAAETGSQTTLCDGVEVWKRLSPSTQASLRSSPVRFSRNVKRDLWIRYVRHHFPRLAEKDPIGQPDLDEVFGPIEGAKVKINGDGSLYLSQAVRAVRVSAFDRSERPSLAFANSLFGPSYNYEAPDIRFDDGSTVPGSVLEECRLATEACTTEIPWQSGDIVMIDNSRVMHGRRAITDNRRRIYTALGFTGPHETKGAHA